MTRARITPRAVALEVFNPYPSSEEHQRQRPNQQIITNIHPAQAAAIASALSGLEGVRAVPCVEEFDVFGKRFYVPADRD